MNLATLSVSIVIYDLDEPIFNQGIQSLRKALDFCVATGRLGDHTITIVDNGNNKDSLAASLAEGDKYIQNAINVGFGAAHNRVIHDSNADYHLVLNPDLILEKTSIASFIQIAEANADIALIGPLGKSANGENAFLAKRYPAVFDLLIRGFAPEIVKRRFHNRLAHYEYQDIQAGEPSELGFVDVQLVSGCCMFLRTKNAQALGAFDEQFFLYFEDFDFSLGMSHSGRVVYAPAIEVTHYGGNTARKGMNHIWMFCRSAWKFFSKNGWKFT